MRDEQTVMSLMTPEPVSPLHVSVRLLRTLFCRRESPFIKERDLRNLLLQQPKCRRVALSMGSAIE